MLQEYETVFRNKNRSTDSEEETEESACFPRKRKVPSGLLRTPTTNLMGKPTASSSIKRVAPPPPPPLPPNDVQMRHKSDRVGDSACKENRISKLYKKIATGDKVANVRGILKRNNVPAPSNDHDPSYGFASRYSDSKSYFRAHNVDNTIPTFVKREDLFNGENMFPVHLRSQDEICSPPQKKRVKFDDTLDAVSPALDQRPFAFSSDGLSTQKPTSLRERIYDFFANLF